MNWIKKHKVLSIILGLIVLAIIGSASSGSSKTATTQPTASPASEQKQTEKPKFDLPTFYGAVQNGMTKDQVIATANGTQPTNCTESETQGFGKSETCSWNSGFNAVIVTFMNNAVGSKTKTGF